MMRLPIIVDLYRPGMDSYRDQLSNEGTPVHRLGDMIMMTNVAIAKESTSSLSSPSAAKAAVHAVYGQPEIVDGIKMVQHPPSVGPELQELLPLDEALARLDADYVFDHALDKTDGPEDLGAEISDGFRDSALSFLALVEMSEIGGSNG